MPQPEGRGLALRSAARDRHTDPAVMINAQQVASGSRVAYEIELHAGGLRGFLVLRLEWEPKLHGDRIPYLR